jgi:RNA polymerase-binding transcription factor DksA
VNIQAMPTARRAEFRTRLAAARLRLERTVAARDAERRASSQGEARELHEIEAAQARLESGTFGVCAGCNQPIPLARLRALPANRFCAICQTRHEAVP